MQGDTVSKAYVEYRRQVEAFIRVREWERFADLFTLDARYRRHGAPEVHGREAIRAWAVEHMTTFPGNQIVGFTVDWMACDERQRHVIYEVRHTLSDPGDGSVHEACTTTMLTYAGNGLWSEGADVHNEQAYQSMFRNWTRAARASGLLPPGEPEEGHLLASDVSR